MGLAIVRDPGVLFVVAVCALGLFASAARVWIKSKRVIEAERLRQDRAEPVDFDGEIRAFENSRDDRLMGERRRVA